MTAAKRLYLAARGEISISIKPGADMIGQVLCEEIRKGLNASAIMSDDQVTLVFSAISQLAEAQADKPEEERRVDYSACLQIAAAINSFK